MDKKRTFLLITLMSLFLLLIITVVSSIVSIPTVLNALNTHLGYSNAYKRLNGLLISEVIVTYSTQGTIFLLGFGVFIPAIFAIAGFVFTFLSTKKNKLIIPAYIVTGLGLLSVILLHASIMFITFGYDVVIVVFNGLYIGLPIQYSYYSYYGGGSYYYHNEVYRYSMLSGINMTWCIIYIVFYSFFLIISAVLFFAPVIPFILFVISLILSFIKKKDKEPEPVLEEQPKEVEAAL